MNNILKKILIINLINKIRKNHKIIKKIKTKKNIKMILIHQKILLKIKII